ncbi:hypothetical protein AVEN_233841-1 [Araneus ventricosus]|uniref:Uncharacterized protein n=1 Tax=Araneus ventricosus TaxID=182803 RepID=A0A4Y2H5I3_ARAVE|nr:hypothetical protein AVEN_233841-1 [Araneus ventricosus]
MKQFVKALPKDGECFKYLCHQCPGLSKAKLKEGVFIGPDIRKMMEDENFETEMETNERKAWESFKLAPSSEMICGKTERCEKGMEPFEMVMLPSSDIKINPETGKKNDSIPPPLSPITFVKHGGKEHENPLSTPPCTYRPSSSSSSSSPS